MDRRRMLAEALLSPAAAPVARREFPLAPEPRIPPGQASMGNATQHFAPLDTVDPTALLAQRLGVGQTVPQTAEMWGQATAAAGFAGTTPVRGIRAFHASPHDFGRFDMGRVGSHTGMAAYSPGIYAASAEKNAAGYRRGLSAAGNDIGGARTAMVAAAEAAGVSPREARQVADNVLNGVLDAGSVSRYARQSEMPPGAFGRAYSAAIDAANKAGVTTRGRMYEVRLNVDPDDLLQWGAPAARQSPRVQERLSRAGIGADGAPLTPRRQEDVAALRAAGVPGLRYVGEGATEAAPNYVMFDDSLIEILRKYGLAGLGIGLGATAAGEQ